MLYHVPLAMGHWLSVAFEVLRVAFVASMIFVIAWQCLKLQRTPLASLYAGGGVIYILGHLPLFRRVRQTKMDLGSRPDEGGGDAAVPALVGAGPRGPRTTADAKPLPEV